LVYSSSSHYILILLSTTLRCTTEKAFEKAEFLKLPKVEQDKYHKNLKVYRDLINSVDTAFSEGVQEGFEKGIEKGMEKGKLEEKKEIAKSLLDVLDVEIISLKTGLTIEEIEKLKKNRI